MALDFLGSSQACCQHARAKNGIMKELLESLSNMPGGEKLAKIIESTNKLHFWSRGSTQAERIAKRIEEEKEEKNTGKNPMCT